jgi:4'-phosphopantetheinyl transferase
MKPCTSAIHLGSEVQVWVLDTLAMETLCGPDPLSLLSNDEKKRASRFNLQAKKSQYIFTRASLRQILSVNLGGSAKQFLIKYNKWGKPYLSGKYENALYFSVSHSADRTLIAIASDYDLGVDIEQHRKRDFDSLVSRYFSNSEQQVLMQLCPESRLQGFYHTWCRKEAYLKAIGTGIDSCLRSVDTSNQFDSLTNVVVDKYLYSIHTWDTYSAAICVPVQIDTILVLHIN